MGGAVTLLLLLALQPQDLEKRVEALAAELRCDDPARRDKASAELAALGLAAEPYITKAAARETDPEGKARLEGALVEMRFLSLKAAKIEKVGAFGGHSGAQHCLFSPDGSILASAGQDGKLKLLKTTDWSEIASFDVEINSFARALGSFSADGKLLLAGDREGVLTLIDVEGKRVKAKRAVPGKDRIVGCTMSPDGRFVAGTNYSGRFKLWNVETGDLIDLAGSASPDVSVDKSELCFSITGRFVACRGKEYAAVVYDTREEKVVAAFAKNTSHSLTTDPDIMFSADEKFVVAGDLDGILTIWNLAEGKVESKISDVLNLVVSGQLLITCTRPKFRELDKEPWFEPTEPGIVEVRELGSKAEPVKLGEGRWNRHGLMLSADGSRVVSAAADVWDLKSKTRVAKLKDTWFESSWLDEKGEMLVGRKGTTLKVWSLKEEKLLAEMPCGRFGPSVSASIGGRFVACSGPDGKLRVFNRADGTTKLLDIHGGDLRSIGLSADGRRVATGGYDGAVRIWDVAGKKLLHEWKMPRWFTDEIEFSRDGRWAASMGYDLAECASNDVRLFDLNSGKEVEGATVDTAYSFAFSGDSKRLIIGSYKNLQVWDLEGGTWALKSDACTSNVVAADKAGRFLADGSECVLYSLDSMKPIRTIGVTGTDGSRDYFVSPDGTRLAACLSYRHANNGFFEYWNLDANEKIAGNTEGAPALLAFSPDSSYVATADYDFEGGSSAFAIRRAANWAEVSKETLKADLVEARLQFSGDGRTLMLMEIGKLHLFQFESETLRYAAGFDLGKAGGPSVSSDGLTVVAGVGTDAVVWRIVPGK